MNGQEQTLSSKARAEFFSLLFGINANELHLREIQRKSGLAIGTIRQEAAKLQRLGLVLKRQDGNRTYYFANRYDPLFSTIHDLVMKSDIDPFVIGDIRFRALSKLLKEPTVKTGPRINPHAMTTEVFERKMKENEH